jgi:peptidoglycan/xylan/chitin deacetylase (PgdA/CDA1 family)
LIIPVLLYHSIGEGQPPNDAWGAVSWAQFRAHVELIVASGRNSLTVSMLASMLRGERPLVNRPVAITFDDGYADTYEAIEVLRRRGLYATVYVTTGEIGIPRRLSDEQITTLARLPRVEVGAHGVRHRRLDELKDSELQYEVRASKWTLEQLTSRAADSFSYPHGAYDERARAAVIAAGYTSATSVKNALSHPDDDPFAIARFTVTASVPAARISEVLEGKHVPLAWTGERLRTRTYRALRRSRQRLGAVRSHAS